jgi:hypothetical protein
MNRPSAIGAALLLGMALAAPAFSEDSPQQLEAERIVAAIEQGGPTVESLLLSALDGPEPEIGIGAVQQYAIKHYRHEVPDCGWNIPELAMPTVYARLEEMAFDLSSDSKIARESAIALSLIRETRQDEDRYLEQLKAEPNWMVRGSWIGVLLNNGLCTESIIQEVLAGLTRADPDPWAIELGEGIAGRRMDPGGLLLEPMFELVQSDEYFLDHGLLWAINRYQPLPQAMTDGLVRLRKAMCTGDEGHPVPRNIEQTELALKQILGDGSIAFDVFAMQSSSEVVWSSEAARLAHGGTEAVLTAIVVHNIGCEGPTSTRKGLRIELRDHSAAHTLFLEDSAVDLVSEQLRNMEADLDHYPEVRDLPPGGCHGTYEFLKRKPPLHQVSMDYCNNLDAGEGMLISVFIQEVHSYHFPGLGPGELDSALDESLATIVMLCSL